MSRPRLLDLFCGAGGCAMGYHLAGFNVVGVDVKPQPRYPFTFIQTDALDFLRHLIDGGTANGYHLSYFDAVHASPPCQAYSRLKSIHRFVGQEHPALVDAMRNLLIRQELPWIIENVPGSCLDNPIVLCGSMFGLGAMRGEDFHQLRRHREFETSFAILSSLRCQHVGRPMGVYGNGGAHRKAKDRPGINGFTGNATERREAMGINWMNRYELSQAIPPAYTEYIGNQLIRILK